MKPAATRLAALMLAAWTLSPPWAAAQPIYRIVGPDGRVTFSDRPPTGAEKAVPLGAGGRAQPADSGSAELPFELRQLVARYPVTLYTGDNCEPCIAARNLLAARGIPYTERTVRSNADIEALQRISGDASVPLLTIGSQRLKGYSPTDWNSYLDAAGYPVISRLPAGYRNPPPQPLAPAQAEAAAPAAAASTPEQDTVPPPPAPPSPSGIVF